MLTFICAVDTVRSTVVPEGYSVRFARSGDIEQLGRIYFDAYETGVGCDTVQEAVADIQASFDGEYGELNVSGLPRRPGRRWPHRRGGADRAAGTVG